MLRRAGLVLLLCAGACATPAAPPMGDASPEAGGGDVVAKDVVAELAADVADDRASPDALDAASDAMADAPPDLLAAPDGGADVLDASADAPRDDGLDAVDASDTPDASDALDVSVAPDAPDAVDAPDDARPDVAEASADAPEDVRPDAAEAGPDAPPPPDAGECAPGDARSCYTGPSGTRGVGACAAGTQRCGADRLWPAACAGEVTPRPEVCDGADNDCDGAADGDAAGRACGLPSATGACVGGRCAVAACASGFGDCDGAAANGCEVDTRATLAHCGRCGVPCGARPGMVATCAASACEYACAAGFADCDAAGGNGCEVDTRTSQAHCGACGSACAEGSVCAAGRCVAPYTVDLRLSSTTAVALLADGTTASWGTAGVLTDARADTLGPVRRVTVGPALQLALGESFACARRASGEVVCWGANNALQCGTAGPLVVETPAVVPGINDATHVASGSFATCAARRASPVTCWGASMAPYAPSPALGAGALGVAAGEGHFCAIAAASGNVYCWGSNTNGQLGRGTLSMLEATPALVPSVTAATVAAGRNHTCVLTASGAVSCWGANESGQLGLGDTVPQASPRAVAGLPPDVVELTASQDAACVRTRARTVSCWGAGFGSRPASIAAVTDATLVRVSGQGTVCVRRVSGAVHCLANGVGALTGAGTNRASLTAYGAPVFGLAAPPNCVGVGCEAPVALGPNGGCAVREGGRLACWGDNFYGQLGEPAASGQFYVSPKELDAPGDVADVSPGGTHTCALSTTGQVRCWGSNESGQLGDGSTASTHLPVAVAGLVDAVSVRAGAAFACAIRRGGAVVCWGNNAYGQLGDGSLTRRLTPVAAGYDAPLLDATALAASFNHACAVRAGGAVVCWGQNGYGEIGDGSTTDRRLPAAVRDIGGAGALVGVTQVSASSAHTCAVRGGAVVCWGRNHVGQLGDGTTVNRAAPVAAHAFRDAVEVAAGEGFTCVRHASGAVSCWGRGNSGQLGSGTLVDRPTPAPVDGLTDAVSITATDAAACARRRDGSVRCWGSPGTYRIPLAHASVLAPFDRPAQVFGLP
ncbi:MAG: hypothetical protein U0324_04035 [Polyangiales bacterium]